MKTHINPYELRRNIRDLIYSHISTALDEFGFAPPDRIEVAYDELRLAVIARLSYGDARFNFLIGSPDFHPGYLVHMLESLASDARAPIAEPL